MTDFKNLVTINYVTDCDTEMYYVGELSGGFDDEILERYLEKFGERGIYDLAYKLGKLQQVFHNKLQEYNDKQYAVQPNFDADYPKPVHLLRDMENE